MAFDTRSSEWYVVPAHEVVRLVSAKNRGQHTENPFESATLSLANLRSYRVPSEDQLRERVLAAIAESARYSQVHEAMQFVLSEARRTSVDSRELVRRAFEAHDGR